MIPVVVVNKTDDSNDIYPFVELMGVKEYVVTPVLRHTSALYTTLTLVYNFAHISIILCEINQIALQLRTTRQQNRSD